MVSKLASFANHVLGIGLEMLSHSFKEQGISIRMYQSNTALDLNEALV